MVMQSEEVPAVAGTRYQVLAADFPPRPIHLRPGNGETLTCSSADHTKSLYRLNTQNCSMTSGKSRVRGASQKVKIASSLGLVLLLYCAYFNIKDDEFDLKRLVWFQKRPVCFENCVYFTRGDLPIRNNIEFFEISVVFALAFGRATSEL